MLGLGWQRIQTAKQEKENTLLSCRVHCHECYGDTDVKTRMCKQSLVVSASITHKQARRNVVCNGQDCPTIVSLGVSANSTEIPKFLPWHGTIQWWLNLLSRTKHEGFFIPKYASKSLTKHVPNICSLQKNQTANLGILWDWDFLYFLFK